MKVMPFYKTAPLLKLYSIIPTCIPESSSGKCKTLKEEESVKTVYLTCFPFNSPNDKWDKKHNFNLLNYTEFPYW